MSGWMIVMIVAAVVIVAGWYVGSHNAFVRLRNLVDESWRQVDVELQRRHDLVPNLVAVVERAAGFQRETLTDVVAARARAIAVMSPAGSSGTAPTDVGRQHVSVAAVSTAESSLTSALDRLRVLAENYPDLTVVRNYVALQQELTDTEDRIAASRRLYNANVRALNTRVESWPGAIVAAAHHVVRADYFQISDPAVRQVVDIDRLYGADNGQRDR